jgi:hypothetical protein
MQCFALAMALIVFASDTHATCPQPVYVIAHRCNAGHWVKDVVTAQGVNAIEADVRWDADGYWELGHDLVGHYSLDIWLDFVKDTSNQSNSPLALVILDIKTPNSHLEELYDKTREGLGPEINLIFSIGEFEVAKDVYKRPANHKFITKLNEDPRAGAAIDYLEGDDENQDDVQGLWDEVGVTDYWFGDGYSAASATPASVWRNVYKGMELRDDSLAACDDARFHGVYTWTYEENDEEDDDLRIFLKKNFFSPIAGVNGIMVNASDCFGFAWPPTAEEPAVAVVYTIFFPHLTGTKFADPKHNPFKVPAPEITCPSSTTVECSAPGGVGRDDAQLEEFFAGTDIDDRGCDAVGDAEIDAPEFFYVDDQASVIFTAADQSACSPSNSCTADVMVVDTVAPTITEITATPGTLWPPNGKMVGVTLAVEVDDLCDAAPTCQITSVTNNEKSKRAKRRRTRDWMVLGHLEVELRAERPGKSDGRIYTIGLECFDASGNSSQGTVEIGVPHDRGQRNKGSLRGTRGQ